MIFEFFQNLLKNMNVHPARWLAAGELGRNSGPFWPQAARDAAQAPRAMHLTRICEAFNISEL